MALWTWRLPLNKKVAAGGDELLLIRRIGTVKKKRLQRADEQELIPTESPSLFRRIDRVRKRPREDFFVDC